MCDLSRVFVCVCMVALISAFASPSARAEEAEAGGGPRPLAESPQALPKEVGPPESYAPSAPEDLAPLLEILDDEEKAIDALRRYDLTQQALLEWDMALAIRLRDEGDMTAATAKWEEGKARLERMRSAYETFLERYPENARAQNYFGELLYDRFGDEVEAIRRWKLAEGLDKKLPMPLNNLAIHYCHAGDYDQGLDYLERTLKLDPKNPDFLFNAVQIYLTNTPQVMERKKWDEKRLFNESMKLSKRATEIDPEDYSLAQDYAVNFFASERFSVEVDWKDAADAWARARPLARTQDEIFFTWLNEARASVRAGLDARAKACAAEALQIHPDSTAAKQMLTELEPES